METVLGMTDLQIKLFTALGQLSVAGIVGYIAYQQWKTARKKLKADLFDRRLSSYRELKAKVVAVLEGDHPVDEPEALMRGIWEIERLATEMAWLFTPSIGQSVDVVREAAIDVVRARMDFSDAENSAERRKAKREIYVATNELNTTLQGVTKAIAPLMQLEH